MGGRGRLGIAGTAARRAAPAWGAAQRRPRGPVLDADQVRITVDAGRTRKPDPPRGWERRTARSGTTAGCRALRGVGAPVRQPRRGMVGRARGAQPARRLIAAGAGGIPAGVTAPLAQIATPTMMRAWEHRAPTCRAARRRIWRGTVARAPVLRRRERRRWGGTVAAALVCLDAERPHAQTDAMRAPLIASRHARAAGSPH